MKAPIAKKIAKEMVTHDHARVDNYYWMRDDKREDPEILAHLTAETAFAKSSLAHTEGFQTNLFDEIVGRIVKDESTVPFLDLGDWHYSRYEEGKEYPIHCRKRGSLDAAEEVTLDVNQLAEGHDYYSAQGLCITDDGNTLSYGEDTLSRRVYTIRFRNLETKETLDERLEGCAARSFWAKDGTTLFYIRKEEGTLREYQVWRHTLGTIQADDVLIYEETDSEFLLWLGQTKSRDHVMIGSYHTTTTEMQILDRANPEVAPVVFLPREKGHEYTVDHAGGRFYIHTNWEAINFRLMSAASDQTTDKAVWSEEIPARDNVFLDQFAVFKDFLVVRERTNALNQLRVLPHANRNAATTIEFDEVVNVSAIGTNRVWDTSVVRLSYTSLTTPPSVIDFDTATGERTLMKEERVLGGFDKADYESARVTAIARDGTEVPVSLVFRKDLDRSKPQPLLLYGYGSYGITIDPTFSSHRVSMLDRGVVWAIAHIRGGQINGRPWYNNGKLEHKNNTFTDFVDATLHLQKQGWTTPDKTFAFGGSAGGLLMGAVSNMRPELYTGVVASVPFVDVVTTMLDETIPLTTYEYDEWGNPNHKNFYNIMLAYSPYDNVEAKDYPNMLIMTGLHDSQVQYWEPAKWVAKLRELKTGDEKLLFHCNMEAGHGGASGRFRKHKETAMMFAFLLDLVGAAS